MRKISEQNTLHPDTQAQDALAALAAQEMPMMVVRGGRVVGILDHADIMRWMAVHNLIK